MTEPAGILARLGAEAGWLRRRRWLALALVALAGFGVPAAAVALLDLAVGFREATAGLLLLILLALSLIGPGWAGWRRRHRRPTVATVALRLETDQPQLMDAAICAVEISQQQRAPANSLQQALLRQVDAQLASVDVHAAVARRELPTVALWGLAAAVAGADA